jgi:hypothetical protein
MVKLGTRKREMEVKNEINVENTSVYEKSEVPLA